MKHSTLTKILLQKNKLFITLFFLFGLSFQSHLSAQVTLYGMTDLGGTKDSGVIFKCTSGGAYSTINNSLNTATGGSPFQCGLVMANDGNFYGIAEQGGTSGDGTIFKCTPAGVITVLVNFNGAANGKLPRADLIQATDGNLYGVTYGGGKYGDGVIFKCSLAGVFDTLASFNGAITGQWPRGSLLQATDGNLYGMTQGGGSSSDGVIFKCTTAGVLSALVNFTGANGANTFYGTLIQATDGNLYGTTSNGGVNSDGTLFKCTLAGALTTLVSFNGAGNGSGILGNIVQAGDGNLYGVTSTGGSSNDGTLFQYTLSTSNVLNTLIDFTGVANGSGPAGGLTLASDGNLYGVTQGGGTNGVGTLFQCTTTGTLTTLVNFTAGNNGNNPSGSLVAISITGINNIRKSIVTNIYPNPSNGYFTVSGLTKGLIVEVYDYTGRKLSSISASDVTMQLNLANYPNGTYLVRVLLNDGSLIGENKIVKMQ